MPHETTTDPIFAELTDAQQPSWQLEHCCSTPSVPARGSTLTGTIRRTNFAMRLTHFNLVRQYGRHCGSNVALFCLPQVARDVGREQQAKQREHVREVARQGPKQGDQIQRVLLH
eukprot:TRINITY_DN4462_c0_g1_i2.p1 TRINITY_DN4462_c0_g1~~TRINITY_DN4462_c0_g1_i2.p1  ORF type:complete len:115 (+),score=2.76 TRINITY_DN4462_c0_g1_i2:638-982(+)